MVEAEKRRAIATTYARDLDSCDNQGMIRTGAGARCPDAAPGLRGATVLR
jgi:hypothetical protein